jgi:hypothetical protein
MSRILFAAIAALAVLQRSLKLSMAADAAGITTDDAACRRTNRGTGRDATGRLHVTTSRPGRSCPPNFTVQDGVCKPYRGR